LAFKAGRDRWRWAVLMIRWLWETLIWPPTCEHDWEKIGEYTAERKSDKCTIAYIHLYRCKKCGDSKKYMVGGA
jgi:hypothetical protein